MNNCVIKGVPNITNIVMSQITNSVFNENAEITTENAWILETDGTNLLQTMINEYVDYANVSNDIIEVYELLGIEAVRKLLIEQMMDVFDEYINDRHVELVCDK